MYAGAGVAAAAGLGYLTKDYWLPTQEQIVTPSPTTTPTVNQSTQPTVTETPTPTITETTTSTPTETTTTEEISEDEKMIRELFDVWIEALNTKNRNLFLDIYVSDARKISHGGGNLYTYKGRSEIDWHYQWHAKHKTKITSFTIIEISILDNKAKVQAVFNWATDVGAGLGHCKFTLEKKISERTSPAKVKLPDNPWRISFEETDM